MPNFGYSFSIDTLSRYLIFFHAHSDGYGELFLDRILGYQETKEVSGIVDTSVLTLSGNYAAA